MAIIFVLLVVGIVLVSVFVLQNQSGDTEQSSVEDPDFYITDYELEE